MNRTPTTSFHIFGGAVTLYGFGVDYANPELNWSLKGIELTPDFQKTYRHVAEALRCLKKVKNIYSPSPDCFNSLVSEKQDFLSSQSHTLSVTGERILHRGLKADGYGPLSLGDAFAMSAADCALVVVRAGDLVFVAHAGRDSLFDRPHLDTGIMSKKHSSVVDAIMSKIPNEWRSRTEVFVGFTLSKGQHFEHPVDHPTYGKSNERLLETIASRYFPSHKDEDFGDEFWKKGQLDMKWLINRQFAEWGVEHVETDTICTFSDTDMLGRHTWFSQRRTKGMRNLFVAVRNY